DAPTGQVPAILDRGKGDEQGLAPPSSREEDTDWAAHEELFEPSMLSDELPAVGSLQNNNNDVVDMERQPWRFDTTDLPDDDTLVLEAELEPEEVHARVAPASSFSTSTIDDAPTLPPSTPIVSQPARTPAGGPMTSSP